MKIGDRIKIINEYYTGDKCGMTGKLIQIDWFDETKTSGEAFILLDKTRKIFSCNACHIESAEDPKQEELFA